MEKLTNRQLLELIHRDQKEQTLEFKNLKKSHYELKNSVTELDHTIRGTKYDQDGGIAGDVNKLKKEVRELKIWKVRIVAVGSTISAILGGLLTFFATRINGIKELLR